MRKIYMFGKNEKNIYMNRFNNIAKGRGLVNANMAKGVLMESKLPVNILKEIWNVADKSKKGTLDLEDFCVALHLVNLKKKNPNFIIPHSRMPVIKIKELINQQQMVNKNTLTSPMNNNQMLPPLDISSPVMTPQNLSYENKVHPQPIMKQTQPIQTQPITSPITRGFQNNVADLLHQTKKISFQTVSYEEGIRSHTKKINDLKIQRDGLVSTISSQKEKLEQVIAEKTALEKEINDLKNSITQLNNEKLSYQNQTRALQQEILRLEPVKDTALDSKKNIVTETRFYKDELDSHIDILVKLKDEIVDIKALIDGNDEKETLIKQIEERKNEQNGLREELQTLKDQNDKIKVEIKSLESSKVSYIDSIDELKEQISTVVKEGLELNKKREVEKNSFDMVEKKWGSIASLKGNLRTLSKYLEKVNEFLNMFNEKVNDKTVFDERLIKKVKEEFKNIPKTVPKPKPIPTPIVATNIPVQEVVNSPNKEPKSTPKKKEPDPKVDDFGFGDDGFGFGEGNDVKPAQQQQQQPQPQPQSNDAFGFDDVFTNQEPKKETVKKNLPPVPKKVDNPDGFGFNDFDFSESNDTKVEPIKQSPVVHKTPKKPKNDTFDDFGGFDSAFTDANNDEFNTTPTNNVEKKETPLKATPPPVVEKNGFGFTDDEFGNTNPFPKTPAVNANDEWENWAEKAEKKVNGNNDETSKDSKTDFGFNDDDGWNF